MINSNIGYIICESEGEPSGKIISTQNVNGKAVAECILQTADEKNRNGRYYAEEELFPQLTAPRTVELLNTGYLRAETGHPIDKDLQRQSTIDDTLTCARFLKLWTEGKNVMALACGTNNQHGIAFDLDLKEGCLPAWSLRALGSIEQTRRGAEVRNLRLITWDCVIYPSHPGAYTQRLVSESNSMVSSTDRPTLVNSVITESGIMIPVTNSDVIKYIEKESSNLKFVRECFDFAYDSIKVTENGAKVLLATKEGDTMVINLESYIHNEFMNYTKEGREFKDIKSERVFMK